MLNAYSERFRKVAFDSLAAREVFSKYETPPTPSGRLASTARSSIAPSPVPCTVYPAFTTEEPSQRQQPYPPTPPSEPICRKRPLQSLDQGAQNSRPLRSAKKAKITTPTPVPKERGRKPAIKDSKQKISKQNAKKGMSVKETPQRQTSALPAINESTTASEQPKGTAAREKDVVEEDDAFDRIMDVDELNKMFDGDNSTGTLHRHSTKSTEKREQEENGKAKGVAAPGVEKMDEEYFGIMRAYEEWERENGWEVKAMAAL
ncbi:MAG: hypothetical protein Q9222_001355 [Ikaeria aurantiellina]